MKTKDSGATATLTRKAPTKTCPKCTVTLPTTAFAKGSNADGLQSTCRECQKAYRKAWADNNAAKVEDYNTTRAAARRKLGDPITQDADMTTASTPTPPPESPNPATLRASEGTGETKEVDGAGPAAAVGHPIQQAASGLIELDRGAIVPSLTNPRSRFDKAFLEELAASIKEHGLAQPLLVRPLPASRLEETSYEPLSPQAAWPLPQRSRKHQRPTHEIVAGEQRWRACGLAGVTKIPVLVKALDDNQVLQLQLVENLKRRDLHPMEEAEGYERLHRVSGLSADEIAERIGKGRSYVYKTLKLLDLEPEAREAFYAGKLTRSTAELVATRPANLQLQVLKEITATDFHGEPMSYRKAKAHVDEHYMLKLSSASFKIADADLVPDAGSCLTCPKRTGHSPELFDDSSADTCTDPGCFAGKKEAHYLVIRTAAEAKGQPVITGREAKEIMPTSDGPLRGYTKVDDNQAMGGQMRTLRKVLGDAMPTPTLIEDPQTHEMVAALPTAQVGELLKAQGIAKAKTDAPSEQEVQRQAAEHFEETWRGLALTKIHQAVDADATGEPLDVLVRRQLASTLLEVLGPPQIERLAELLSLGRVGARDALAAHVLDCDEDDVDRALVLMLAARDLRELQRPGPPPASTRMEAAAKVYDVDLVAIKDQVKADMTEAARAKAGERGAAAAPAAPGKPARKAKTTKAEAAAAIAAQLQAADNPNAFAAGQRVRIKIDLRKGVDVFKTRGMYAEVVKPVGDRAWEVQPEDLAFTLFADYTEMETAE